MNKVTIRKTKRPISSPQEGDIYCDEEANPPIFYILALVGIGPKGDHMFRAIALDDGNRWNNENDINKTTEGLKFVGRNMRITQIKNNLGIFWPNK